MADLTTVRCPSCGSKIVLNGPRGFGFLLISGYQDPTSEWLEVEFNKGERSYRIYGGPRDCSENVID